MKEFESIRVQRTEAFSIYLAMSHFIEGRKR